MLLLSTFTLWLLLAFLSLPSAARRGGSSRGSSSSAASRNSSALSWSSSKPSRSSSNPSGRGKFTIVADKMQCTWAAKDVGDAVRLAVKCENPEARITGGVTDLECQYNGKPQLCPAYASSPQGFWKQVTRAFKRHQGKVCKDERALVKASMCKRAPRDVHFKLDIHSSVSAAQSGGDPEIVPTPPPSPRPTSATKAGAASAVGPAGPTACPGRVDPKRRAEENCSSSWASLCTFFFSMLQSDEC